MRGLNRPAGKRSGRIAAMLVLLALAGLATLSASQLAGSIYHAYAVAVSGERPAIALQAAQVSVDLDSGNLNYLNLLARLRAEHGPAEAALASYRRGLRASPGWPYAWASVARQLAVQGRYDEGLQEAIARSRALGPSERHVHYSLATMGVGLWYRLTPPVRHQIEPSIRFTLQHERARQLLRFARNQRRERWLCRRYADLPNAAEWCVRRGLAKKSGG